MRVVVLVPKTMTESDAETVRQAFAAYVFKRTGVHVSVETSDAHYRAWAARQETPDVATWARAIGAATLPDLSPVFTFYVALSMRVGRGIGLAVQSALVSGRPVVAWDAETEKMTGIRAVVNEDPQDFAQGWLLIPREPYRAEGT